MKRGFKIGLCIIVLLLLLLSLSYIAIHGSDLWDINCDETITFNKTFGEEIFSEYGYSVKQTLDDGYVIVGNRRYQTRDSDVLLIKLDEKGREEWNRTIEGKDDDYGLGVFPLSNGNYIVTGYSEIMDRYFSYEWLMEIDRHGNKIWNKTINHFSDHYRDPMSSIIIARGSGYYITNRYSTDYFSVFVTDSSGNTLDIYPDRYYSLDRTSDDEYVYLSRGGIPLRWIIYKTDSDFKVTYLKKYKGWFSLRWESICQLSDNGYIVAGYNVSRENDPVQLMKTDVEGNLLWEKNIEIAWGWVEHHQVTGTDDGGFLINLLFCPIIVKMDDMGNKIWERDVRSILNGICITAYQTRDGGYIVLGNTASEYEPDGDITLLKLNSNGLLHEDDPHSKTERDWSYLLSIIGILVLITADIIVLATIIKKKRKRA